MSAGELPVRRWRWIWLAVGAGIGLAVAVGWSVIVVAANGFVWWRADITYDATLVAAALILLVTQIIGGVGVLAALVLLVWRRTRPLAVGALVGGAFGVGLYLATDALFARLVG